MGRPQRRSFWLTPVDYPGLLCILQDGRLAHHLPSRSPADTNANQQEALAPDTRANSEPIYKPTQLELLTGPILFRSTFTRSRPTITPLPRAPHIQL